MAITALMGAASCDKAKSLADINVDIPYNSSINVPDGGYTPGQALPLGGVSLPFPALPIPTNSKSYIEQYHTSTDKIRTVGLKSLQLEMQAPTSYNFDFLDTVQVYISTRTSPEQLIAYQYNVAKGLSTIPLTTVSAVNLKDYFIQDTIYFRLSSHINAVPPSGTQLNIKSVFHMVANPLY